MRGPGRVAFVRAGLLPLLAASGLASAAHAADAEEWQVAKTKDRCTLIRSVTTPQPTMISLTTDPGSDSYQLTIAHPTLPEHGRGVFPAAIVINGGDKRISGSAMAGQYGNASFQAYQISDIDPAELSKLANATSVSVAIRAGTFGPVETPDAGEAIAAFEDCTAEHLVAMGADAKQFQKGGAKPIAVKPRKDWISFSQMADIGAAATAGMKPGTPPAPPTGGPPKYKLAIDTRGRVDSCARIGAAGSDAVEKATCAPLLNKTLFKPAHDPAGNAVRGVATYSMPVMGPPGAIAGR